MEDFGRLHLAHFLDCQLSLDAQGHFLGWPRSHWGGGVTGNEQDSYGLNWSNTFGSFVKLRISKDILPASTLTFILYMHVSPNVSSCFTCL